MDEHIQLSDSHNTNDATMTMCVILYTVGSFFTRCLVSADTHQHGSLPGHRGLHLSAICAQPQLPRARPPQPDPTQGPVPVLWQPDALQGARGMALLVLF